MDSQMGFKKIKILLDEQELFVQKNFEELLE